MGRGTDKSLKSVANYRGICELDRFSGLVSFSDLVGKIGNMLWEFVTDLVHPILGIYSLSVTALLGFAVGFSACGEHWGKMKKFWPFLIPAFGGGIVLLLWVACIVASCILPSLLGHEKEYAYGGGFLLAFVLDVRGVREYMKKMEKVEAEKAKIAKEEEED